MIDSEVLQVTLTITNLLDKLGIPYAIGGSLASIDTEDETYKAGWRGATPRVELVSLCDPEAALIRLNQRPLIPKPTCSLAFTA